MINSSSFRNYKLLLPLRKMLANPTSLFLNSQIKKAIIWTAGPVYKTCSDYCVTLINKKNNPRFIFSALAPD